MLEGIISQYGFLYQKYYFIKSAIEHASMDVFYTYEGIDDIDVESKDNCDGLSMVSISKNKYIQVKSGTVSKECWAKVLGNWLLIDDFGNKEFVLVCENSLEFNIMSAEIKDAVYEYFLNGKNKTKRAVARKVYDKYLAGKKENAIKNTIEEMSNKCVVCVSTMEEIISDLCKIIIETYCTDIKIYEKAKQERCNRFVERLVTEIDGAIQNKRKYTLSFQKLIEVAGIVQNEISDTRYNVDTAAIKKLKHKEAEKLVMQSELREIKQLKLVKDSTEFITREIINELLYKDFRDVYDNEGVEISNIEDIAYTNYQDALFDTDSNSSAKELYSKTTEKEIYSSIMQNSPIYRKGCYIYLTGEKIEKDKQISWGNVDDE